MLSSMGWHPVLSRTSGRKVKGHDEITKGDESGLSCHTYFSCRCLMTTLCQELTSLLRIPTMTIGRPLRQEQESFLTQPEQNVFTQH